MGPLITRPPYPGIGSSGSTGSAWEELADALSRRQLGSLAGATVFLAGCGNDGGDKDEPSPSSRGVTLESPLGRVRIPSGVRRVVSLSPHTTVPLLDVGFTPVRKSAYPDEYVPDARREKWDAIPTVPSLDSGLLNIEALAKVRPDLIIGAYLPADSLVDKYREIATTALLDLDNGSNWDAVALQAARAVGRQQRGRALKRKYEERLRQMRSAYAGVLRDRRFAVVDGYGNDTYRLLPTDNWGMQPLTAVGIRTIAAQARQHDPTATISYENLGILDDADVILLGAVPDGTLTSNSQDMVDHRLWQRLAPVRDGRVFRLPDFFLYSYSQAFALLDALETVLKKL